MAKESDNIQIVRLWCHDCQDYFQARGQEEGDKGTTKFVRIRREEVDKHRKEKGHAERTGLRREAQG